MSLPDKMLTDDMSQWYLYVQKDLQSSFQRGKKSWDASQIILSISKVDGLAHDIR